MKSPSPARSAAFLVLRSVMERGAYLHLALRAELARAKLDMRDAGLASDIARGVMTWRLLLEHYVKRLSSRPFSRIDASARIVLLMSLYQLRFLDRVPAYAVLSDAVEIAKEHAPGAQSFVNAILRAAMREAEYPGPLLDHVDVAGDERDFSLRASYPEWLVDAVRRGQGESEGTAALVAMNGRVPRTLRVHTGRVARATLLDRLRQGGLSCEPLGCSPAGIALLSGGSGGDNRVLDAYREGLFTWQGAGSMQIAPLLEPRPGARYLDACAAPGGKATHIAELSGDQAEVVACDVHAHRARQILDQANRLGLRSIRVQVADCREVKERFTGVLLDAPCSGLGSIARKPDLKWRVKPDDLRTLARLQAELLRTMAERVEPGGFLVYAVCTLTVEEGPAQIAALLDERPDFALAPWRLPGTPAGQVGEARLLPDAKYSGDGFYVARLIRKF